MLCAPSLLVLLVLALGIVLADAGLVPAPVWAAATGMSLCLVGWALRRGGGTVVFACLSVMCAAAFKTSSTAVMAWEAPTLTARVGRAPVRARLRVVGPVRAVRAQGRMGRQRTRARLLAVAQHGMWQPQSGEVMLHLWLGEPVAQGDTIVVVVALRAAPKARNLGDLDAASWARRSGLSGRAQVHSAHLVEAHGPLFVAGVDRWRQRCAARLEQALGPHEAALARAMALGDATSLPTSTRQVWADAGLAHLLAVSGLHLALVMGLVSQAVHVVVRRCVYVHERWHLGAVRFACALFCGVCFAVLSGDGWASLRALGMAAVLGCAQLAARRQTALQALGVTGACMLWLWPMALFDLGFLLSYAAVFALALWAQPGPRPQPSARAESWRAPKRALNWLVGSLRVCAVAQLATAPLCAHAFGRIACTSALSNIVAVPMATPAVVLSLCCAVWGPFEQSLLARLTGLSLRTLQQVAHGASGWPGAFVWAPRRAAGVYAAGAVLFVCISVWRQSRRRPMRLWARRAALVSLCAVLVAYAAAWQGPWGNGCLQVDHLDVGQGDATLVTFPQGLVMLVDGGGSIGASDFDPGRHIVAPALERRGIRRIDVMLVTHPHPDHLGGLLYIAEHYAVRMLWLNGDGLGYRDMQTLIKNVTHKGGQVGPAPPRWHIDGVTVTSYMPLAGTWASANDHSLVLKLVFGARSIVLAGDVEGRAEALLAERLGQTDVIKVGHHGSRTSSSDTFLQALKPQAAVVSCGEDNAFGFPHAETLARLAAHQVALWRTDTMGALHLQTQGKNWRAVGADGRPWLFAP